jgi:NAD(P)-dependent dehydrogenase (short-subunit alcohol dehydrogenase family)
MANLRFAAPVEQRVALVTGGARGLGAAAALRMAEAGRNIVIVDVLEEQAQQTVGEVRALGRKAICVQADVTVEAEVHAAVSAAIEVFGRLDILVCCAGILGWEKPFLEQTAEQFAKVMAINVHGAYYAHQAAVPYMLERGWGRCVTISSGARNGSSNQVPYSVSKGAVYSFIGSLGSVWAKEGVFVNGVEPGRALTEMVVSRFDEEHLKDPGNPMGRYSDANEVAEVIEFLCSERNTYTTGAVWSVKGASG